MPVSHIPHWTLHTVGRSPASPGNLPYLSLSWRRPAADGPQAECELWCLWHVLHGIWGTNTAADPNISCNSDVARNCFPFRINTSKKVFPLKQVVLEVWSGLEGSERYSILNQDLCMQEITWNMFHSALCHLATSQCLKWSTLFNVWNCPKHAAT